MKGFFKDYKELCDMTGQFYKQHWFGTIVMSVATGVATMALLAPKETKKEFVKSVKSKFKKEES